MKLTEAKTRYLRAASDWSAPYEIAERFGWPASAGEKVKPYLGRLIGEGLVKWSGRDTNTYRITDLGRRALAEQEGRDDE